MSIPSNRVELKLNILGLHTEKIWVRATLSQESLVAAIVKRFGDQLLLDSAEQYALFRSGETQPTSVPFGQIRNTLHFWERRELPTGTRRPSGRLVLLDMHGTRYPVSWVPGVIGRESKDQRRPQAVALPRHARYPQLNDTTSRSYLIIDQGEDGAFTVRIDGDSGDKPALLRKLHPTSAGAGPHASPEMPIDSNAYPLSDGDAVVLVNGAITLTARIIAPRGATT
ncbi:hypothetical protein K2Z83_19710 [Oscillochloris sp. ZM17-4]|uniref:hypothetical protein n=1 Tax=Oscillochloris sp. ZM17-4 TaxID=2866714 RepID=UPI001C732E2E|nr:hypothetical protein [Oscillochloris sp. ZM17-4]MBX0329895.1 hypothetical protein [Oscillochloris sp. ZM17-4]